MDNVFQELDYSDISAKNLSNKRKPGDINTKTRGGIIRLGSMIIIAVIMIILIIGLISKSNTLSNLEAELNKLQENYNLTEKSISDGEEKNYYLNNEILDAKKFLEKIKKQKDDINNNLENLEISNRRSKKDIDNAKEAISFLQENLKEFEKKKALIEELQKNTSFLQSEINRITYQ